MPANLDVRFTRSLGVGGILHQIIIPLYFALGIQRDDCTATVQKRTETLASSDFGSLFDTWIVSDAAHQHRPNGNYGDGGAGRALDDHNGASVLTEDVKRAWLVDCLWIDSVVAAKYDN